jgi:hypothetical protein
MLTRKTIQTPGFAAALAKLSHPQPQPPGEPGPGEPLQTPDDPAAAIAAPSDEAAIPPRP